MSDAMPPLPNDPRPGGEPTGPIDDMPTELHDDWVPPGTKPEPEPELASEAQTIKAQPVPDEEALNPIPEPPQPVSDVETLEGDEWPGEEEAGGGLHINPRLILVAVGGGVILLIAIVLAVLFLPPFYLAATLRGCQAMDANSPSLLRDDGLTAKWTGPDSVRLCVNSVTQQDFQDGKGGGAFDGAVDAIPVYLQLKSPVYTIEKIGSGAASLEIALPGDTQPNSALDLYRWDAKSKSWIFVPGHVDTSAGTISTDETPDNVALFQSAAVTPLIGTNLNTGDVFDSNIGNSMNLVMPSGITLGQDNTLGGSVAGGWQMGQGYGVLPVVKAADPSSLSAMLNNDASVTQHISDLKSLVVGDGYNGVVIDYEGVAEPDSAAFSKFIADLSTALHEYDKQVLVVLPAPTAGATAGTYNTGGYDWRAIGAAADAVIITPGDSPDDYAVNGDAVNLINWATGEVNRLKIYLAFPTQSAKDAGGSLSLISYDDALAPLGKTILSSKPADGKDYFEPGSSINVALDGSIQNITPDQNTGAFKYSVTDSSGQSNVWIVTASTIRARLDMASSAHIGGMILDGLMSPGNDGGLPTVINEFKASQASSVPSGLQIRWTVTGSSGAVVNDTGLGTPFAWQAGPSGDYKISAAIVGGKALDRGEVALKVAEPPTPTPTRPPVVVVQQAPPAAAATQAPSNAPAAPPPVTGGGGGGGAIELGGQVPGSIGHASAMQQAHMKWVKFQAPYGEIDPGGAAGYVAAGHSAGFKVLLSLPGSHYPTSIDYGGYISYVTAVAGSHPDAIEVWNEMNIKNEWPSGQIDPNAYVNQMLAPAFNAIKTASPSTMVIIGALAPTGFDNGTDAWSDQRYAAGMAAAGAGKYADCVGVHHNSGTTAPNVSSGRPEGDHYSWYFLPTINVDHTAAPNLPVCLTEFGYLTPEGYGPLPSAFSWGQNTTLADQAAWLAQGYQIAQGLGYVRLVIVWNVDFTQYGDDPQAGYAIVRQDGSCPACASLGAVAN